MKKSYFVFTIVIILLTSSLLNAQTDVSGLISSNTIWTIEGSPYIVTGNVLVNAGITLTINPGVTVKFNKGLSIQINGTLLAQGTSNNKITFTSNTEDTAGAWGYIYFSNGSTDAVYENDTTGVYLSGSILEHCIIEYAGGAKVDYNGALRLDGAHPFINYCTIRNNNASGIRAYSITGSLKITNSIITNNISYEDGGGINIYHHPFEGEGNSFISGNTISGNYSVSKGGGIYTISCHRMRIYNNIILNNTASRGGGICNDYHSTAYIFHNIIMNNNAYSSYDNVDAGGAGIHTDNSTSIIWNNIIANNVSLAQAGAVLVIQSIASIFRNVIVDNISVYKAGGLYSWFSETEMINNHIIRNASNNDAGIYSDAYNKNITFNTIAYNKNTDYNNTFNRTIYIQSNPTLSNNNIFNNSAFYELYNGNPQGSTNLNATNNWWGTTNNTSVQAKIYDWFDNGTLGIINFNPYLTSPDTIAPISPPANVIKTDIGGGQVKIVWNRNHESDLAGYNLYYGNFNGYSFTNFVNVGNDTSYILSGASIKDTIGITAYDNDFNHINDNVSTIVNDNMTNGNESWFAFAVDTSATTVITHNKNNVLKGYVLKQNYPNPFNPITTIEFEIPKYEYVSLKVYNVLGEVVDVLVNQKLSAGNYKIQWNAEKLPSGLYFYRLNTSKFTETRKLILIK